MCLIVISFDFSNTTIGELLVMDRSSQTYQADASFGCTSTVWNRDQTQPPKLPAQTATPKTDDYPVQKGRSPLGNSKARLSAYDCRPVAAKKAGYCYDYLLNLCMPKDHSPLPKELIERITSQNYETRTRLANDLESHLQYAEWFADHGDKVQMKKHIVRAQENARELDLDISHLLPSTNEEKYATHLRIHLENYLRLARKFAYEGDRFEMDFNIQQAHSYATLLNINISDRIPVFIRAKEEDRLRAKLENELNMARQYAEEGNKNVMKFCIDTALSIADQLHIDIRERIPVTSAMKVEMYWHKQLESTFVLAMDYALEGDKASMERALSSARYIAFQLPAEIDISSRVAEISDAFHYKFETLPRL